MSFLCESLCRKADSEHGTNEDGSKARSSACSSLSLSASHQQQHLAARLESIAMMVHSAVTESSNSTQSHLSVVLKMENTLQLLQAHNIAR